MGTDGSDDQTYEWSRNGYIPGPNVRKKLDNTDIFRRDIMLQALEKLGFDEDFNPIPDTPDGLTV